MPSLTHEYGNVTRPEVGQHLPVGTPRIFRTDEYGTIRGPGDSLRNRHPIILFLGGSTTETNEVDERFRFSALTEELLNSYYRVEATTWNSGIRGHTTTDSINLLLNHPSYKNADYVVMMHNINDRLRLAIRGDYHAPAASTPPVTLSKVKASAYQFLLDSWDFVSYQSNLLFALRTQLTGLNPFAGERDNPAISERMIDFEDINLDSSLKQFRTNLRVFIAVARALKQTPIIMTQPLGKSSRMQSQFNDVVREVSSRESVLLIDLEQSLPSNREWLFLSDKIHLNNDGSIAVAHLIARELSVLLGSRVPKENYKVLNSANLKTLSRKCLPPPERGQRFVPGPRHLLISRSGRYPSFSADGQRILFQTYEGGHEHIQIYDVLNQQYDVLSNLAADYMDRHPVVLDQNANDGSLTIAFGSDRSGSERIYLLDWPSKKVQPLLPFSDLHGAIPARGPGKSVLFAGFNGKSNSNPARVPELFMYDRDSKQLKRLTNTENEEWRPVASQDGKFVYYIFNPSGDFDIFRILIDGKHPELIYRSIADEWDPTISPNGRWVAFASKQNGNWDLFLLDLSNPKTAYQITNGQEDDWDPAFYLDERMLAFASSQGNAPRMFMLCAFGELTD